MNRTKHRRHRHNGAEDRQGRARPKESAAPNAEDQSRKQEHDRRQRTPPGGIPTHPPVRSVAVWGPIAAVTLLAFLVTIGVWRRVHERGQEKAFTRQATQLEVNMVNAQRDRKPKELILPGTFQAFQETTIYPRINGYVKSWKADIGDNVKEGQLLAEIETPEVDQQRAQAKANYDIAKVTADRWRDLAAKKVVSAQENDEKQKAAEAARANLEQLEKTQGFKEIVAPFGGSISARNIDVGTLVTAGTGNAGTPLFRIVQSDPLRVYVYVPQTNAPSIHEGLAAKILVQEFPGQNFDGGVTRAAGALDPQSRTMQVEVQVPNHEGKLYAGMYGQVKFLLADENAPIVVPANAFLFRTEGPQVATVAKDNRIHWQTIRVGRDFGTQLEVLDGLAENTGVVINPTDDLAEGIQVQLKPAEKPKRDANTKQSSSDR
jgi:RND family efflux transporter MFP subunit